jgi:predicted Zn-dependent protease/cellulose synthase/poly-beta-1,6-N-acetylglucosamine synthase-like glycosyltransferase
MTQLRFRKLVIVVSSAVALFYLGYRAVWTLNLTSPYAVFASLFLYIGEFYGVVTMLLYFLQVWDTTEPPEQPVLPARTVEVFVPTYNEDPDILRVTLRACVAMDYPHKTYLCDDGGTEARLKDPQKGPGAAERAATLKAICAEVGAIYMTRPKNEHAKAGNLNHAFAQTDGEFILIFDADHVPDKNFITRLIGYFADEKLAFVQTPHAFYNFDSFQARLNHDRKQYWEEGQLFYHVIQPGRNRWNAPIFAGSAAIFRRKALAEVGYIATETITEDMHTGLRMHARGWKSLGISTRMISGQAAQDVTTFHSQRLRWGEGNLSVLAYDNPLTNPRLSWGQRLCYLGTMINWCGGLFKLPIYLTPLLMLFTGVPPVKEFSWTLALVMVAYMAVSILGTKFVSNGYGSIWYSELFMMASFWTQVRGTMRAAFLRKFQQFIVTAKRGRQSKSIWPFIRPQVYLIVATVTALLWAWGRIWLGISDDCFKPVLATFWGLFHLVLAYVVVRRAMWPDDRRFSTRHTVHIPVGYAPPERPCQEVPNLGVSIDVNERGLGFFAYERLAKGTTLHLTLYAPAETVTVHGEIRWSQPVGTGPAAGFRYGVAFKNPSPVQTDALHRIGLHYAVPRLYASYAKSHTRLVEALARRLTAPFRHRRFAPRREYHLPLLIDLHGDILLPTVTEDLSRTSASVLLNMELGPGTTVDLRLGTPLGTLQGTARVVTCRPQVFAARTCWRCALEFTHFQGSGWEVLQQLFTPAVGRRLGQLLQPSRPPRPVPMNKPLAAALLVLAPLAGVEFAAFRWVYRDDFFLQSLANSAPATPEDLARLDGIFKDSMRQQYPATDRLVLLSRVLNHADRPNEMTAVLKKLAIRDRSNLDLQVALAQAYDQEEEFDNAEAEYQRLLQAIDQGRLPETRREELLVAAARSAAHAGRMDLAAERFALVMKTWPERSQYRNEFAGTLLGANRLADAARLYEGCEPDGDGRGLLVLIHIASQRYDAAEKEARALVQQQPGDATAEGMLADVLNLRGQHLQAQAIYLRLLAVHGSNLKIAIQLAHGSLWAHNYQEALARFQSILDRHFDDARLTRSHSSVFKAYVNAAASAPRVGPEQRKTTLALFDRELSESEGDVVFLARLAWVLHRLGEDEKSTTLLERAAALEPTDPAQRLQVAAGFLAVGRPGAAQKLLEGQASELQARGLLADAYIATHDFTAAAGVCRAILADQPGHVETRAKLADILSWNKEFKESQQLFKELAAQDPGNPVYPVRLAEVALWAGDAPQALERYEALLRADFRRSELWWGFVDAAAASPRLTPAQASLAQALRDAVVEGEHKSARAIEPFRREHRDPPEDTFLTRLAWVVIEHLRSPKQAGVLLDRAVALQPAAAEVRKELAGVLAAVHRYPEALKLYEGLPLGLADRLKLGRIHAGAEDFPAAAEQCHLVLRQQPLNKEAQVLLADVFAWQQQFSTALEMVGRLLRTYPGDEYLRRRQAEVLLWSGDTAQALELFEAMLATNFEQPLLWRGFMDAAARADSLRPAQKDLLRQIAARPIADQPENVEFLARSAWALHHHLEDKVRPGALLMRAVLINSPEPAVLARLAWVLHQVGDRENRDRVLKRATAIRPRSAAVNRELAAVLAGTGHSAEARALYEDLARANPRSGEIQIALAEVELGASAWPKALEHLESVAETEAKLPHWRQLFVDAAAGADTLTAPQARLLLQIADGPAPGDAKQQALYLSRLSWALVREGKRENAPALGIRARALLDKAMALEPSDARVRQELTGVLLAAGRAADALPWLEEFARKRPEDAALQRQLVQATLAAGNPVGALGRLEKLLEIHPVDPELLTCLVDAAAGAPRGAMTAAQLDRAQRLAEQPAALPDQALHLSRLAWVLFREGRREQASNALDKGIALAPQNPKVRRELADMLIATGRHRQALVWLEELLKANPDDAALQGQLARATLWSGNAERALERLGRLLAADFEQPELWLLYVDAAGNLNKGTLTPEQVRLAVQIARRPVPAKPPDKVVYLSRLAWVLHREEHPAEAGLLLDQAIALNPQDPKVRRELAGVLVAAGRNEAGLRLFDGLTLTLEDRYQLVVLHAAARQFSDAEKHCRAILRESPHDGRGREWQAHLALWSTNYARALDLYQALLEEDLNRPGLWEGYIEAASFVDRLTPEQVQIAVAILDTAGAASREAVFLARGALVLQRHVERPRELPELNARVLGLTVLPTGGGPLSALTLLAADQARTSRSRELLLRAIELRPKDARNRVRLAWVVHRMGYAWHAARVLDEAIELHPVEPAVRRELGDVLVATGRLKEGMRWFEELVEAFPNNRDLAIRRAEVTVWAGQYALGLDRVEEVLGKNLEPRSLWHTFVDAASSAPSMSASQTAIAERLAEQPVPLTGVTAQAAYFSRLAWSLFRESDRSNTATATPTVNRLLDEALRLQPRDRDVRLELAGVLTAVRRYADASGLYEGLAKDFPGDVNIRVRLAELAQWSGDSKRSLERFEKLWQEEVRGPRVWVGLVNAAASARGLTSSQAALVGTLADHMPSFTSHSEEAQYLSRLSWALVREGKTTGRQELLDQAGVLLDRAVALQPEEARVSRELAGTLSAAERHREGLRMFEGRALDLDDRFQLAVLHTGLKQFDEAEKQLKIVLAQVPDDKRARQWLAQVALGRGRCSAALRQIQERLEADFHQPALWRLYANALANASDVTPQQVELAMRLAAQPVESDPDTVSFLTRLAWGLYREGKKGKAPRLVEVANSLADQAVALDPRPAEQRRELAGVLAALGKPRTAWRLLEGLKETDRDRPLRISLLAAEKRLDEAEVEARRLVELNPTDAEARLLLADVLGWNSRPVEAARIYERLLRDNANDRRLPGRLAEVTLAAGDYDKALARYHELLAADWRQPEWWTGYVDAAASARQLPGKDHKDLLLKIAEQTAENRDGDATFLMRLGWVLRRIGEPGRSVAILKLALRQNPDSHEVRTRLAEALQAAGDYAEAERHYEYLLRHSRERP